MNLRLTEKSLDRVSLPAGKAQVIVWDEEVPGFGVVVGRRLATFIANYRANGAKRRQVIGRRGEIREDGTGLRLINPTEWFEARRDEMRGTAPPARPR